jgi:hypothetical protein
MEEDIFEIIRSSIKGETDLRSIREASERVGQRFKMFTEWKDDLNCPFVTYYNGTDKNHDKVSYMKGNKIFRLSDVWKVWAETKH